MAESSRWGPARRPSSESGPRPTSTDRRGFLRLGAALAGCALVGADAALLQGEPSGAPARARPR
ncbi:MAG TPA: hypothetical protein VF832_01635, partial [Longimicrobiales bacterium]